jgi:hypothetical protein
MVALDPSARADAVRGLPEVTRIQCLAHPCDARWCPATIGARRSRSQGRQARTVVRVHLLAAEPDAFLATGQPFTLWADAIVADETIRGEGLLGDGAITGHEPEVRQTVIVRAAPRTTACLTPPHGRTVPQPCLGLGAPAMAGRQ